MKFRDALNAIIRFTGSELVKHEPWRAPEKRFHSWRYLQNTVRRLEHLSSLGLSAHGKTVLEVGAGIGDLSGYFIDRGCKITITEAREENLAYLRKRFPREDVRMLELESPKGFGPNRYEVIFCYGLLYHLKDPASALEFLAEHCEELLLLETCVSFGSHEAINPVLEAKNRLSQSFVGVGCRPTRPWVFAELKKHFPNVYVPRTQPNHPQFPIDWTRPEHHGERVARAVFIASRKPIAGETLSTDLLDIQVRHI